MSSASGNRQQPFSSRPEITRGSEYCVTMPCSHMHPGKGHPHTIIPLCTVSPTDNSDRRVTNRHLLQPKLQPQTPSRSCSSTSSLITPPNPAERTLVVAHQLPSPTSSSPILPRNVFPPLPHTISELTPLSLCALSRSLSYSPDFPFHNSDHVICIPYVTPEKFYTWKIQYKHLLYSNEFNSLWEYSPDTQSFIIKCMPTPIHENIANYAMLAVLDALRTHTGADMYETGISVYHNTEIETTENDTGVNGRRIPDLSIKVCLHPLETERVFTGVIWEIGFSQTLASLKRRARMWLSNTGIGEDVKVHLVVLVHVFEEEARKEYLDDNGEVIMSRDKAKKMKWDWPIEWFGGRGIVQEVKRRARMKTPVKDELKREIREDLKREIRNGLLGEDGAGRLMPCLMESLGAKLLVYQRRDVAGQAVGTTPDHRSNEDNEKYGRSEDDLGTEQDSQDTGSTEHSPEDLVQVEASRISSTVPDFDSSFARQPRSAKGQTHDVYDADDDDNDDNDDNAYLGIEEILNLPLVHKNVALPNLSSRPFSILIAELYGSLPSDCSIKPKLLNKIPPLLRPHANKKICFPLDRLAAMVLRDNKEMRKRRAGDRARGIVDRAWAEVVADEERLRKEGQRLKKVAAREGRRAGRTVRKIEVVGDEGPEEHAQEDGEGGRSAGLRQKRARMERAEAVL
ncbi:hypothetical protein EV426DRAFT_644766 [Tirmania nivea]|nr:hypothetical protein EV426DRAFT_644766 [Tirmania nivea]